MSNRARLLAFVVCGMAAFSCCSADETEVNVTAQSLLDDVVVQLPQDQIKVSGTLCVRQRKGVVVRELRFDMDCNWGAKPSTVKYTIMDAFGSELEQMTVKRPAGGRAEYIYKVGNPPVSAAVPDLAKVIQGSDIGWLDLTLSFLWWKGGTIKGSEDIKGRSCYIVEVPSPDQSNKSFANARLWVDKKLHMLLQAESLDVNGKLTRKLWIKSFKKINDRWIIKDMEIEGYPSTHRTKLRIQEVDSAAFKAKDLDK